MKRFLITFLKKTLIFLLLSSFIFSPLAQTMNSPLKPLPVQADEQCSAGSETSASSYLSSARVGGVSLDQAATFLSDMSDITGAYYDPAKDRIVFVGQKNTTLPKFDKDDLAVAIRAIIFNGSSPYVSMDFKDPSNIWGDPNLKVIYGGGIEDTQFGKTLVDADYKLKQYVQGYNANGQKIVSAVSGYKSHWDRYLEKNPDPTKSSWSRWWISPQLISLKEDDTSNSFLFDQVKMQVRTEGLWSTNDPKWNEAATEFSQQQTDFYDQFAQETPSYFQAKQLAKIVGIIKWIDDNHVITNFEWARDYQPKYIATPREIPRFTTPPTQIGNTIWKMTGGVDYNTDNSYGSASGTATSLKTASEAVDAPKEESHWTFTKDGKNYEAVAVAASAFRSLGAYTTSQIDFSFPANGDLTLTFQREHSSFSGGQKGIGRGWDFSPGRLTDPTFGWTANCTGKPPWKLAFQTQSGLYEAFTYTSCTTGYSADKPEYHSKLIRNTDNTFIVQMKDQTEYLFDATFKLTQIKDKNGNSISYTYDTSGKLNTIKDGQNHALTLAYNTANLIASVSDWSGRSVQYGYDTQGNLTTVTDPRTNVTTYTYDTNNKLASIKNRLNETILTNTYTLDAKIATQKDASGKTLTYTYDEKNKLITVTDNLGRITKATYDDKARILTDTDALNKSLIYTYGVEYTPITVTDKNTNKTTYTYDTSGNLKSITFPNNKNITYEYDTRNRLIKILDYRYGLTPKQTIYTYDQTNGNLLESNEAGILTKFTYFSDGEVKTSTNHLNQLTQFTRDSFGNVLAFTDPLTNVTENQYDTLGRLNKIIDPEKRTISYAYDFNNNLINETNSAGTTSYTYDKENRLTKTTLPTNSSTEFTYDATSSLRSVKDALTNTTSYGYDTYQNLITQQDSLNQTTRYLYDELNRQKQTETPLGNITKWEYDGNGNLKLRIDAANKTTTYIYDNLDRLKTITYPDTKTVSFTYDDRGNLTQMIDPAGTTKYDYDLFDRLKKVTNPFSQAISYEYDEIDQLKKIIYPDLKSVQYDYYANNLLKTVTDWNTQGIQYTYEKNGLISKKQLPNGVISSYTYDLANRLSSIEYSKDTTQLAKFSYTRDNLGNITKVTEEGNAFNPASPSPSPSVSPSPSFMPSPSPTPSSSPIISPAPSPTASSTPGTSPGPSPTPMPDLVVTNISLSNPAPKTSEYFDVFITVKNQGTATTTRGFYTTIHYDLTSPPTTTTSYNAVVYFSSGISPGQEVTEKESLERFTSAGNHTVWSLADRHGYISESNETNNAFGPLTVSVTASAPEETPPEREPLPEEEPPPEEQVFEFGQKWNWPGINLFVRPAFAQTPAYVTQFTYDVLSRLTDVIYPDTKTQNYTYDKTGNRLTEKINTTTTSFTYNKDQQLTSIGPANLYYDPNGNLKTNTNSQETRSFTFNFDNFLLSYASSATQGEPVYTLSSSAYKAIDAGYQSTPTFVDIDNDQDQDLFIGESYGTVKYYKNTGTATSAAYTLDTSLLGTLDVGSRSTPALADIDGDGDQDLFIGRSTGEISFYKNTGTATVPAFTLDTHNFKAIDMGSYSIPVFTDLDGDGDKDLLSGEYFGTIKYYKNTGNNITPAFTIDTTLFSGLDVGSYSAPAFVDLDKDSDFDLFIGNSSGTFSFYRNTGSKTNPAFTLVSNNFGAIDVGSYSSPAFVDIDNDADADLFSGEYSGVMKQYTASLALTSSYTYDGLGNRLQKKTPTTTTRYVNDVSGDLANVLVEANGSNVIQNYSVYGLGFISQGPAASTSRIYPLTDGQGNIRFLTNSTGTIVKSYSYDPFGNIRSTSGTSSTNYQFSSEQLDPESGFYFLRARYYDPKTGRFISRDPVKGVLTNPQTQNPYVYVGNNPVNLSDPSGKYWGPFSIDNIHSDWNNCNYGTAIAKTAVVAGGTGLAAAGAAYAGVAALGAFGVAEVGVGTGTIYWSLNNANPTYIGKTIDLERRAYEWARQGRDILPMIKNIPLKDLSAVEQATIEKFGLSNLENIRNAISPQNPIYDSAIKIGQEYLKKAGF